MANQTITVNTNHDALTGRLAGEDFTINSGAKLTIDSMPHLTAMGILGDITINDGELHIDGSRTYEVAYSGGSGTLPAVGAVISWNAGVDTGKIVRLNSGNNVSGVLTLTKDVGEVTPDSADAITNGSWTADLDTVKVGFLIVFGEDQDYGAVDAKATIRITGDWHEVYTGTGANSQTFTLPHTGHQHALWVETGEGTGIYEIWHRISSAASTIFYDSFAEFGVHFHGGKVFQQAFGSNVVTFGTSTNGGVVPNLAKVRIPNVHMGTTSVATPTTEINSTTYASHTTIIPPGVTCNVFIDHLNASSVIVAFSQTNGAILNDSAIGLAAVFIDRCGAAVSIKNTCFCCPSVNTTGGIAAGLSVIYTILDMLNGVTIEDCVFYGGIDTTAAQSLWLQTSKNIIFKGTNKIALAITDENTSSPLRLTTSSDITNEGTLICLGGGIIATAASNNVDLKNYVQGLPIGRGATEPNQNAINAVGVDNWLMSSFALGIGTKAATLGLFLFTDSSNITLRGAGSPSAKVDLGARATYVTSFAGICSEVRLQRLYFTNLNGTETFFGINSVKGVTIENCSTDYGDEMEADCNDMIVKGVHVASGAVDSSTGFEGDMANVVGTCFYDHFKSDTTGGIGLLFNNPSSKHASDVAIPAGTPIFNGLGALLMRTLGDKITYTFPYLIKGHTSFQNIAIQTAGTNTTTNHSFKYQIKAIGGSWGAETLATAANLSNETISPAGFYLRIIIECTTAASDNAIKGFAILTNTTLANQASNYYPLDVYTLSVIGLKTGSDVVIYKNSDGSVLDLVDANVSTSWNYIYETVQIIDIGIFKAGYIPLYIRNYSLGSSDTFISVAQVIDRAYLE